MHMGRRLLAFGLFVALPALVLAQEPKLVNCRTLEAAGNFVGPDEVIVDDMVCQKAKPGADAAKQQAQKPVIGTVVSDATADNVVDAAKAAEKRVANRREQDRNAIAGAASAFGNAAANATSTEVPASSAPSAPPVPTATPSQSAAEPVGAPAGHDAPAPNAAEKTSVPAPPAQPAALAPGPTLQAVANATENAPASVTETVPQPVPSVSASEPVPPKASAPPVAAASVPTNSTTSESSPREVVNSSNPVPAAATAPPTSATPSVAAEPTPASPVPAVVPSASPAETAPADSTHPATSSGFYDANAPKRSANLTPQNNSGFASAEQVNAGLTPGATSIPPSAPPATGPAAPESSPPSTDPEPQHTTIAASRIDFDADRERSVKLGDFARPHEVSPDPSTEHRTSVDPSAEDGFQDRQRPDCTKNVTLAGLSGEKLVLGVPSWAAKWIEKNEKRMPQICFSETPMKSARNYLIVFSTSAGEVSKEAADTAVDPAKSARAAGVGTFTTLYGSTWHYSFDRNVGTTILTQDDADEPHGVPGQVLYATAYTEEGVPVAQRWPGQLKKELKSNEKNPKKLKGETEALEHVSSDLLSQMVEDIAKL